MDENPLEGVPSEILRDAGPDKLTRLLIDNPEASTLCGGRMKVLWRSGPWKGDELPMYCQQPNCMITKTCTGPIFVPAYPLPPRKVTAQEIVAGARECAKKATGKDDPRSDREIARHAGSVLRRARESLKTGGWSA